MTFKAFRKYEKPLLWAAVIFTVAVFAFFPSFGGISDAFSTGAGELAGSFVVATTGASRDVTADEFFRLRRNLARFQRTGGDVTDEDVWGHLIMSADAEGAGLEVSDADVADFVSRMLQGNLPLYAQMIQNLGFPSTRIFEVFLRDFLRVHYWQQIQLESGALVDGSDVYQRWRVDNEIFDLQALVFADLDPEEIDDPGDETLRTWFEALDARVVERSYSSLPSHDVVLGWLPLDAELRPEGIGTLAPPTQQAVAERFRQQKPVRFPELEELDDATRELLRHELLVMAWVGKAHLAFVTLQGEGPEAREAFEQQLAERGVTLADPAWLDGLEQVGAEAFRAVMSAFGLRIDDPEGPLTPDELTALPSVASLKIDRHVRALGAGSVRFVQPFSAQNREAAIVFVEAVVPARPLSFEEARERILETWRDERLDRPASDFREELRVATRELPEVQALITPLEEQARQAAEARIAAATEELDDAARAALLAEELERVEPTIAARVAEHEHLVWDRLAPDAGAETLELPDVPRSTARTAGDDVDRASLEWLLKTRSSIFQLAVDGISDVLRHPVSGQSAVVRVVARRFPPEAAMAADREGMLAARDALAQGATIEAFQELEPGALMASHELRVPKLSEPAEGP